MYKLCPLNNKGEQEYVYFVAQNVYVPFEPANTHYQEYLKWLAEGNEPLPADE